MPNAYISGTGFYVPDNVVTNDDLRTKYGIDTTDDWIKQRTGIGCAVCHVRDGKVLTARPISTAEHATRYEPRLSSSEFCGSCRSACRRTAT